MLHTPLKTNAPGVLLGGETQGIETAGSVSSASTRQYTTPLPAAQVLIYADGACEPMNPGGWATWGCVALDAADTEIGSGRGCVAQGRGATNNLAEYTAALQATDWALAHGLRGITLRADSKLVVEQTAGTWACNAEHLRPLRDELRARLAALEGSIEWIPRAANVRADALSRLAYTEARKRATHGHE